MILCYKIKLKENIELAEAATLALEHIYEEEPPPVIPVLEEVQLPPSQSTNLETIPTTIMSDNISVLINNRTDASSSPTPSNDNLSTTSPPTVVLANDADDSMNSTIPPPPPSSSSLTATTISTTKTPTTVPLSHSAAYRQQTSLLGALPTAAALRTVPGGVYATAGGLSNSLNGQILYGGKRQILI